MAKLRNKQWIWGQTAGTHNLVPEIALPRQSFMTPIEGSEYFGIPNMCRVVYQGLPVYPYDQESAALSKLNQVVWSIADQESRGRKEDVDADIAEVVRQAKSYTNITGAVLDDFFARKAHLQHYSVEDVRNFKRRLSEGSGRELDLWIVIYTRDIDKTVEPFLKTCDVISLWTWQSEQLKALPEKMAKLKELAGAKKRYMTGCYLWDYGPSDDGFGCAIPDELMSYQLDLNYKWLKNGEIDGVIFCSNCVGDIGLKASDMVRDWIVEHGDEDLE